MEAAGWKGDRGTAPAKDAARGAFFRRYASAAAREGILRLGFMRLGGRAIAMQLAVECGERFWSFKTGYDEAFTDFSPGILLDMHLLARSAALGLRSFELLGFPDASHKQMRRPVERPCVTLRAYPYGPRGLVLLGSDAARLALLSSDAAVGPVEAAEAEASPTASPPLRWEWLRQWWRVYGPVYGGRGLRIVTVHRGGHLIALCRCTSTSGIGPQSGPITWASSRRGSPGPRRPVPIAWICSTPRARPGPAWTPCFPRCSTPRWAGGTSWTCAISAGARLCWPCAIRRSDVPVVVIPRGACPVADLSEYKR